MKRGFISALMTLLVLFIAGDAAAQTAKKPARIAVVQDGPSAFYDKLRLAIEAEVRGIAEAEFDVQFDPAKRLTGDWTAPRAKGQLDTLLQDPEVDLVIGLGVLASDAVMRRNVLPKPCVAPLVINRRLQGLVGQGVQVPRANLSYVTWSLDMQRDYRAFQDLGEFKRIAVLVSAPVARATPGLRANLESAGKKMGLAFVPVLVETTGAQALRAIPTNVDAVYVAPNPQLPLAELDKLAAGLKERRLPSFSWAGREHVQRGILMGLGSPDDMKRLARRVALNIQSILLGEDPRKLATAFKLSEQLVINMATARAIGLWPNWNVISEAVLINQKRDRVRRKLTMAQAVRDAMRVNLDLIVQKRQLRTGEQDIRRARSALLPQLGVSATGSWIDKDRAGFGQAERTLSWSATLQQSIFSEAAWGNLTVQQRLQKAREYELAQKRLDVARDVAVAYLGVLRAQTAERIQRQNLSLTRENLTIARLRRKVGTAGPSEVFRWESQIALGRRDVISTVATRNQAEIELNRLLNRPLEESFITKEASLDDSGLMSSHEEFRKYLANPFRFKTLREFMVREALRASPELRQLNAQISAQVRNIQANRRSLYLPSLGAQASTTHRFLRGGAGSSPAELPPPFDQAITNPDTWDWQVGITASIPLFEGGARYADIKKGELQVAELNVQKKVFAQLIEQRIRSGLHRAGASYPAIRLTGDAAKAAKGNLNVVSEAYGRGAASIVDLLDAQNQALIAEFSSANAVYEFLTDLMEVERALGRFDFFRSADDMKSFFGRLNTFSQARSRTAAKR